MAGHFASEGSHSFTCNTAYLRTATYDRQGRPAIFDDAIVGHFAKVNFVLKEDCLELKSARGSAEKRFNTDRTLTKDEQIKRETC